MFSVRPLFLLLLVVLLLAFALGVRGRDLFVSPVGSANATGTRVDPFATLTEAAAAAAPSGDRVVLLSGTHVLAAPLVVPVGSHLAVVADSQPLSGCAAWYSGQPPSDYSVAAGSFAPAATVQVGGNVNTGIQVFGALSLEGVALVDCGSTCVRSEATATTSLNCTLIARAAGHGLMCSGAACTVADAHFEHNWRSIEARDSGSLTVTRSAFLHGQDRGITVANANVAVTSCFFQNNTSPTCSGGALSAIVDKHTITCNHSAFLDNIAYGDGGALRLFGRQTGEVADCFFSGNRAVVSGGGAIFMSSSGVELHRNVFVGNSAVVHGGAIIVRRHDLVERANVVVDNCTFSHNAALEGSDGGAIYADLAYESDLLVGNCSFEHNNASLSGGAIAVAGGLARVGDSFFQGNDALGGGGGHIVVNPGGGLELCDSILEQSTVPSRGGAIKADQQEASEINVAGDGDNDLAAFSLAAADDTTATGTAAAARRQTYALGEAFMLVIENVEIRNARAGGDGGCVFTNAKYLHVANVTMSGCNSGGRGGAMALSGEEAGKCVNWAAHSDRATRDLRQPQAGTDIFAGGDLTFTNNHAASSGGTLAIVENLAAACPGLFRAAQTAFSSSLSSVGSSASTSEIEGTAQLGELVVRGSTAGEYGPVISGPPASITFSASPARRRDAYIERTEFHGLQPTVADTPVPNNRDQTNALTLCPRRLFNVSIQILDGFGASVTGSSASGVAALTADGAAVVTSHGSVASTSPLDNGLARWENLRIDKSPCAVARDPEPCLNVTLSATVNLEGSAFPVQVFTAFDDPIPADYCVTYLHGEPETVTVTTLATIGAIGLVGSLLVILWYRHSRLVRESSFTTLFPTLWMGGFWLTVAAGSLFVVRSNVTWCFLRLRAADLGHLFVVLFVVARARVLYFRYGDAAMEMAGGQASNQVWRLQKKAHMKKQQSPIGRLFSRHGSGTGSASGGGGGSSGRGSGSESGLGSHGRVRGGSLVLQKSGDEGTGGDVTERRRHSLRGVGTWRFRSDWEILMSPQNREVRLEAYVLTALTLVLTIFADDSLTRGGDPWVDRQGQCDVPIPLVAFALRQTLGSAFAIRTLSTVASAKRPAYDRRGLIVITLFLVFAALAPQLAKLSPADEFDAEFNELRNYLSLSGISMLLLANAMVYAWLVPKAAMLLLRKERRAFRHDSRPTTVRAIDMDELELDDEVLAAGSYGVVFRGHYLGNVCVAKMLHNSVLEASRGYNGSNSSKSGSAFSRLTDRAKGSLGSGGGGGSSSGGKRQKKNGKGGTGNTSGSDWDSSDSEARIAAQLAREEFIAEGLQLSTLPAYSSIVQFFGMAEDDLGRLYLVSELVEGGSLNDLLHDRSFRFSDRDLLTVATNLAGAMLILHRSNILHLDLAARNLLVFNRNPVSVKLCDFGLSHTLTQTEAEGEGVPASGRVFSARWYEPPLSHHFSFYSDVYGFGSVLWETMARRPPWPTLEHTEVVRAMKHGKVPTQPRTVPPMTDVTVHRVYKLARSCWNPDVTARPSFADLSQRLRPLKKALDASHEAARRAAVAEAEAEARFDAREARRRARRAQRERAGRASASSSSSSSSSEAETERARAGVDGRRTAALSTVGAVTEALSATEFAGRPDHNPDYKRVPTPSKGQKKRGSSGGSTPSAPGYTRYFHDKIGTGSSVQASPEPSRAKHQRGGEDDEGDDDRKIDLVASTFEENSEDSQADDGLSSVSYDEDEEDDFYGDGGGGKRRSSASSSSGAEDDDPHAASRQPKKSAMKQAGGGDGSGEDHGRTGTEKARVRIGGTTTVVFAANDSESDDSDERRARISRARGKGGKHGGRAAAKRRKGGLPSSRSTSDFGVDRRRPAQASSAHTSALASAGLRTHGEEVGYAMTVRDKRQKKKKKTKKAQKMNSKAKAAPASAGQQKKQKKKPAADEDKSASGGGKIKSRAPRREKSSSSSRRAVAPSSSSDDDRRAEEEEGAEEELSSRDVSSASSSSSSSDDDSDAGTATSSE